VGLFVVIWIPKKPRLEGESKGIMWRDRDVRANLPSVKNSRIAPEELGYQCRPSGLVARSTSAACISVEIFVEKKEILPLGI
jgi:hypothetical protein